MTRQDTKLRKLQSAIDGTEDVATVWGETKTGYYLLHVMREPLEFPELKHRAGGLAEIWSPQYLLIERSGFRAEPNPSSAC
jgi:hypothetical protein